MKRLALITTAALLLLANLAWARPAAASSSVGFSVNCTGAYGFGEVPPHASYDWKVVFYDPETSLVFTVGGVVGPAAFNPVVLWPIPPSEGTTENDSYYWWEVKSAGQLLASGEGHFSCQPPPPPPPLEGCTPGYWKQPHHFDSWVGYAPAQSFEAVFGRDVPGTPSLLNALGMKGGGLNALMRHATAALLNTSSGVNYGMTPAQVISAFQAAFDSGNFEPTKDMFDAMNNRGCPLN